METRNNSKQKEESATILRKDRTGKVGSFEQ